MKVADLGGADLDYWVARAMPLSGATIENDRCWIVVPWVRGRIAARWALLAVDDVGAGRSDHGKARHYLALRNCAPIDEVVQVIPLENDVSMIERVARMGVLRCLRPPRNLPIAFAVAPAELLAGTPTRADAFLMHSLWLICLAACLWSM